MTRPLATVFFEVVTLKRVLGLVVVFGMSFGICRAATVPHKVLTVRVVKQSAVVRLSMADLAPADEYFGPLKMSILGIRNTIKDLGLRYDVNHDIANQTLASAALTERSIRDWEHKYPKDSQLPRSIFFLQRLYTKVLTLDGRNKAKATATWLLAHYGASAQAHQLKKIMASEHLAPLPDPAEANKPNPESIPAPAASAPVTVPSAQPAVSSAVPPPITQ